ncbi:M13 family metallopeptidase [Prevotella denticola]|uniref:M13 family metallopeptidase n=1 Tax=Prevotella denticola TaxID=28129 RepID=UPI0002012B73|nr:M13 family metallopeptidase [Prevotella denticola]AEA20183.1 peptidase family M13 [Prevotella denticola F0289]QUB87811.1 M13 family metallopeptidase [Prevotella denticola]
MKIKTLLPTMLIASAPVTGMAQSQAGIKAENLDKSVRPADDFFTFATGGWQKRNPLPAAFSRFGSFDQLQENNNKRINTILSDLLKKRGKEGTVEKKLGDFYRLAMDSVRRNKEGVSPVRPLLDEMEEAKTLSDLRAIQLKYVVFGYGVSFDYGFDADEKNAKMNILNISQGGLTLGQKEYYLDNDKATSDIRNAYRKFIVNMFRLYGFSDGQALARRDAVMRYETMLALLSKSRTELRDVEANYNKMTLDEFKAKYPEIPLEELANAEGIRSEYIQSMVVGQPAFLAGVDRLASTESADELRARMEWSVILSSANYLSDDVRAEYFSFFSKTMRGTKQDYPRWKRATQQVESQMGEALGRIYCERYFPATSKKRMEDLIKNLQASLAERIKAQDWMSEPTKQAALEKLSTFYVKVGYPDKWKNLSQLAIDPSASYYKNVQACRKFWSEDAIREKAGKPVDKNLWLMTPQTVNAYYNPTTNEICFPAGILQYPFFDPKADDAFNYGAIGVVIGHEMTHGFDDQGRHYDKDGNMTDWWTAEDGRNFEACTGKYADFFSAIKVLPDLNANGKLTLGENLADHGGLEVAFNAFEKTPEARKGKVIMGFTPEQRFFIAYAGVWANNITEAEIRSRVKSDPHSLGEWRVNGALPHIDAWYKAFGVKESDKLFIPESERLKLW